MNYAVKINNVEELKRRLNHIPKDTIIISHIHLDGFNYKLHKIISCYNKFRVYVDFWANDISLFLYKQENKNTALPTGLRLFWEKTKGSLRSYTPLFLLIKFIKTKGGKEFKAFIDERRRLGRLRKTESLYDHYYISVLPKQQYSINHPDYEKYLNLVQNNQSSIVEGRYIVFIDQYYPHHPTLKAENPDIDFESLSSSYYKSLNTFFDRIEQEFNCKVVIAGHPIAKFNTNPYGNREVIYYKTAELVHSAFAVCLHNSYSISFVLLFDKPFCLLTNNAHQYSSEMRKRISQYSHAFDKSIVNTDTIEDVKHIFEPARPEIRKEYINTFFDTSITEHNDILLSSHIEKIHSEIVKCVGAMHIKKQQ